VFHGVMDYPPNINAAEFLARQVMPRVRAIRPQAKLALVGRAPTARIRALARQPGVEVTGEVPDLRPWLQGSRVGVCPMLIGTGIKNKLLEAMASGLPCVATTLSVRGLQVADGRELFVADDAEALAAHLVRLLDDDALAASIGAAGRAYVRAHHGWDRAVQSYEAVYQEVRAATPAST
jgi:glycosyltransferase involved in cell wall biosynthesis